MATRSSRSKTKLSTQSTHSLLLPMEKQQTMNYVVDSNVKLAGHELDDQAEDGFNHEEKDKTTESFSLIASEPVKGDVGNELNDQTHPQSKNIAESQQDRVIGTLCTQSITKFDGSSDPTQWLEHIMSEFDAWNLTMNQKNELIPQILTGEAFIWYANHHSQMPDFLSFVREMLKSFTNCSTKSPEAMPSIPLLTETKVSCSSEANMALTNALRTQMIVASLEKFPKYAGKSKQNVTKWLTEIQQSMHLLKLTDEEKLLMIPSCLEAEARDWYFDNMKLCPTWMSFVRELKQIFESSGKHDIAFNRLRHCEQTMNQGVRQYYFDIIKLCKEANPNMDVVTKLQYLKDGLKPSLRFQVLLYNPKTPEEFLQYAQKVEELKLLDEKQTTPEYPMDSNPTVDSHNSIERNEQPHSTHGTTITTSKKNVQRSVQSIIIRNGSRRKCPARNTTNLSKKL